MIEFEKLLAGGGLSLERLATVCRVVEAGGVARAAAGDPSRLSLYARQVRELEEFFGVALTRRQGRTGVPTDAARRLAVLAREHLGALEQFRAAEQAAPPRLALAASQSVLEWFVAPRLRAITRALPPGSRLVLLDLRTREVAAAVESREVDLGLLRWDAVPASLTRREVAKLGYALFVPDKMARGRKAGAARDTSAGDRRERPVRELLAELPLAVSLGGSFREQLEVAASRAGVTLNIALECASFTLAAAALRAGTHAAVLPDVAEATLGRLGDGAKVLRIPLPFEAEPVRRLAAAWLRRAENPHLPALRDALTSTAEAAPRR